MKKTFVSIFLGLNDIHLIQNLGQVGNYFAEIAPIKPIILCYTKGEFPSLKTEAKNQTIYRLENKGRFLFFEKTVLHHVITKAKQIDFLYVQHLNKADIYQILFYKLLNRKGKVILKLDINLPDFNKKEGAWYSRNRYFNFFHKFFEKRALKSVDLIAADSPEIMTAYKEVYPYVKDKIVVFSQNLNDKFLNLTFPNRKHFEEKENIILTTGRIGAADKNYELLLETLPMLDLKDWKVIFVGKIYNEFDKKVESILSENPSLKGKVEVTGYIDDRLVLYHYYNKSKVFCLTSVLESFGVSFIEALYFGNYVIGNSGMSSFDYISNYGELGKKLPVNNAAELAKCLNGIINNEHLIAHVGERGYEHVAENFFMSKNIGVLKNLLD